MVLAQSVEDAIKIGVQVKANPERVAKGKG